MHWCRLAAPGPGDATGWVGPRWRDRYARRVRFNDRARLRPVGVGGRSPDRDQRVPSLLQIQRFLTWATRIEPAGQDPHAHGFSANR